MHSLRRTMVRLEDIWIAILVPEITDKAYLAVMQSRSSHHISIMAGWWLAGILTRTRFNIASSTRGSSELFLVFYTISLILFTSINPRNEGREWAPSLDLIWSISQGHQVLFSFCWRYLDGAGVFGHSCLFLEPVIHCWNCMWICFRDSNELTAALNQHWAQISESKSHHFVSIRLMMWFEDICFAYVLHST